MKLTIHYYSAQSDWRAEPYCFSNPTGEFENLHEAREHAQSFSMRPQMGAASFSIRDELGAELERWKTLNDGDWVREQGGRRFDLIFPGFTETYLVAIDDHTEALQALTKRLRSVGHWHEGCRLLPKGYVRDAELTAYAVEAGEVKRVSQGA